MQNSPASQNAGLGKLRKYPKNTDFKKSWLMIQHVFLNVSVHALFFASEPFEGGRAPDRDIISTEEYANHLLCNSFCTTLQNALFPPGEAWQEQSQYLR